jgi:AraC family transcriptional regulator of adaptative response/methylated-DNA-[protein]-cysteine methyltransferase
MRNFRVALAGWPADNRRINLAARPLDMNRHPHHALVQSTIERLVGECEQTLTLDQLAAREGLSPFHLQRIFTAWAGVSPKRFQQFLGKERALASLRAGRAVLEATFEAGLSSPGRLHDLLIQTEAASPGEVGSGGVDLEIRTCLAPTPLGTVLIGQTDRGVCHLRFVADESEAIAELRAAWPQARFVSDGCLADLAARLLTPDSGPRPRLSVRGTNFQIKVWEALLRVPPGALVSYGALADAVGAAGAARAVGAAVGANPVAVLIPCHRVIQSSGALGGYRWGLARKAALIANEWIGHSQEKARHAAGLAGV